MDKGLIVHTVVLNSGNKLLLIQRAADEAVLPGYWDIPGGTLEDGEDPAIGAIRETKEETGLDIQGPKLFFYTSNVDVQKNKQFIRLLFVTQTNSEKVTLNPREHVSYEWISPSEITNYKIVDYLEEAIKALPIDPSQSL